MFQVITRKKKTCVTQCFVQFKLQLTRTIDQLGWYFSLVQNRLSSVLKEQKYYFDKFPCIENEKANEFEKQSKPIMKNAKRKTLRGQFLFLLYRRFGSIIGLSFICFGTSFLDSLHYLCLVLTCNITRWNVIMKVVVFLPPLVFH